MLVRLAFRAAAVAALVWIARELMRRWVDGPEEPTVAGNWETWQSPPLPDAPQVMPVQRSQATKAGALAPVQAAGRATPEAHAPDGVAQTSPPTAERRPRPLKAARLAKADPADPGETTTKKSGAAAKGAGATAKRAGATAKKAGAATKRAGINPDSGTWVSPNGSGEAPATHPVKAKVASRVYRVPGMPMYERTAPDRCYVSAEAAEADGFTRAAR